MSPIAPPAKIGSTGRRTTTEELLRTRDDLPTDHPDRGRLRAQVIEENLSLANRLAHRYAGRGQHLEDLAQVAALGLIKATDGYDPSRQTPFAGYAVPTIAGALKRHFRDTAWPMRVSRSIQELAAKVPTASDELCRRYGRSPTGAELADHLHVSLDDLRAAVGARRVSHVASLNAPSTRTNGADLMDLMGETDPRYDGIDDALLLRPLIAALPVEERRVIIMRFYLEMTQSQIAAEIGRSQMHVSRLLRRSLARLRAGLMPHANVWLRVSRAVRDHCLYRPVLPADHDTRMGRRECADGPAIVVSGLGMAYGGLIAVDGLNFRVERGEIFALLGPNGAGKTTTVEILEGHRRRTSGQVRVLGFDPWRAGQHFRDRVGVVLQSSGVDAELTVAELVGFYASLYAQPRDPADTIEQVGLTDKRKARARTLSGGQLRRLDLALALVGDPELIFLDEPTTGFDPDARRSAWDMIDNLRNLGKTILLTSHYLDEVQHLADRVAVLSHGRIIASRSCPLVPGMNSSSTATRWPSTPTNPPEPC